MTISTPKVALLPLLCIIINGWREGTKAQPTGTGTRTTSGKWILLSLPIPCFCFFLLILGVTNAQKSFGSFRHGNVQPYDAARRDAIRVYVQLDTDNIEFQQSPFLLRSVTNLHHQFPRLDTFVATFTSGELEKLRQDKRIANIWNDPIRQLSTTTNHSPFGQPSQVWNASLLSSKEMIIRQLQQQQTNNLDQIQIPDAHLLTRGEGVKVCLVDSGIDANHLDLNRSKLVGLDSGDANLPWDQDDEFGHGTHVAGIIAASPDNDAGIIGVSPESEIFIVRTFRRDRNTYSSDIVDAALQCVNEGNARIIVLPLAGKEPSMVAERIFDDMIQNLNVLIVAAAGNFGPTAEVHYPAGYPNVLSVGAVDGQGALTDFTQMNAFVDLVAPGKDIMSLYPNDRFATLSGTSMACAHVAGVAALLWSIMPDATVEEIKNALFETARLDEGTVGRDDSFGYGLVQAQDALLFLMGQSISPTAPPLPSSSPSIEPSVVPSNFPTWSPSEYPSFFPSFEPSQSQAPSTAFQGLLIELIQSRSPETSFENELSSQFFALNWMVTKDEFSQMFLLDSTDRLIQRFALVTFWHATGGPTWNFEGWLNPTSSECEWDFSIDCLPSSGLVTELHLPNVGLRDVLPPEVGLLTSLKELEFSSNIMTGTIPTELGKLTALTSLGFFSNRWSGTIPTELGNLTALKSLSLSYNSFNGTIPSELGRLSALQGLGLTFNQLTGTIPTELGNLTALTTLGPDYNQLSGSMPTELGQLTALISLHFFNNALTGPIPSELGQLSAALESISVHDNQLTGPIPSELGQLSVLRGLSLENNRLNGTVPLELERVTSLRSVDLYNNEFEGNFPARLCTANFGLSFSSRFLRPRIDCGEIVCDCCDDARRNPCP